MAEKFQSWGNVIIIRHDPLASNGQVIYSRYSNIDTMLVKVGDHVTRGQQITTIGNVDGTRSYFLHFDISPTNVLEKRPLDWPGKNKNQLETNYVDPKVFIEAHRPADGQ